jgi:hypothetical protein
VPGIKFRGSLADLLFSDDDPLLSSSSSGVDVAGNNLLLTDGSDLLLTDGASGLLLADQTTAVAGTKATETDTATAGTPRVAGPGTLATETDAANAGTPRVVVQGSMATSASSAIAGSARALVAGTQASSTNTANAGTAAVGRPGRRIATPARCTMRVIVCRSTPCSAARSSSDSPATYRAATSSSRPGSFR